MSVTDEVQYVQTLLSGQIFKTSDLFKTDVLMSMQTIKELVIVLKCFNTITKRH